MSDPVSLANAFSNTLSDKRIEVLRKIGETGSISQAARETGISYKAAWQAIDTLTNLTGTTLVEKVVGGIGGGGAKLTEEGIRLLEMADVLLENRNTVPTLLHIPEPFYRLHPLHTHLLVHEYLQLIRSSGILAHINTNVCYCKENRKYYLQKAHHS